MNWHSRWSLDRVPGALIPTLRSSSPRGPAPKMPVYEYQCGACSHEFEEWQKITSDPVKTCPKCGKDEVQRLISQTAFQLKGGGWYKDLYSSSSKKNDKSA